MERNIVLFDLGWTLAAPAGGDWMLTRLFHKTFSLWRERIAPAELAAARASADSWLELPRQLTTPDQEASMVARWYALLGESLPGLGMTAALAEALARDRVFNMENYVLLPGAEELLYALRHRGYRLGLISNTWPGVKLQMAHYDIEPLFESLTYSYALGVGKPHPDMYRDALAKLGCTGSRCWIVDDRPENLIGAESLGIRGVQAVMEPGVPADGRFPAIHAPLELLKALDATDWAEHQFTLTMDDLPAMMALQAEMAAALPSPRWYFTSTAEEFAEELRAGRVLGIRAEGELAAFAIACPAREASRASYAAILGRDEPDSLDFQDVIVSPRFRRRGIHSHFLRCCERQAREGGMTALYATVDPDNIPSLSSFEKAGWQRLTIRSAYDGRIRAYYRKELQTGR